MCAPLFLALLGNKDPSSLQHLRSVSPLKDVSTLPVSFDVIASLPLVVELIMSVLRSILGYIR